jgi:hypothetical protein
MPLLAWLFGSLLDLCSPFADCGGIKIHGTPTLREVMGKVCFCFPNRKRKVSLSLFRVFNLNVRKVDAV